MFTYQADCYCDSCGLKIREQLTAEGLAPTDPDDEYSYDSDDFPKWANEEARDHPNHCASDGECFEGIDLSAYGLSADDKLYGAESRKVGAILESLTEAGETYTLEIMADPDPTPYQCALYRLWRETFDLDVPRLECPECGEEVWDGPVGSKLAKCWNAERHASGTPLAFDTMEDED